MPRGKPGTGKGAIRLAKLAEAQRQEAAKKAAQQKSKVQVIHGGGGAATARKLPEPDGFDARATAERITEISASMKKMLNSGLKQDTIVLLVHDDTKLPKRDIAQVLRSLAQLEERYVDL